MEILERPNSMREGFAPLDNIGFCLLEVNLEGDVYTYSIPGTPEHCKVEHASINGLLHTTIDDHLLERIWQYLQAGYSDINISRETGVPAPIVSMIRRGKSLRYRTDKYTWPKSSVDVRELDRDTIFSIYDAFTYTDKSNSEIGRKYNVSPQLIYMLRRGHCHSKLACEYVNSKGLDGYWCGYRPQK